RPEWASFRICCRNAAGYGGRVLGIADSFDPNGKVSVKKGQLQLKAFEQAGIGPGDISLAEVHDATAFGEVKHIEALGLCPVGEGGVMTERGETRLGGRVPVNPSGGLLAKGHPVAATGAIQVHELVTQLRGEAGERQVAGARIAVAGNGGGSYDGEEAVSATTILGQA
ncbi:MAG: hypothetical protein IT368_12720, partial [Candidatus Hydrogenedentes bacterium]|nr:hypothetical protein [Candidatus Hydrogenedentota bacterium]